MGSPHREVVIGRVLMVALTHVSVLLLVTSTSASFAGCRDESGQPIDWWGAVKINNGAEYLYFDSSDETPRKSKYTFSDSGSGALSHTLNLIYKNSSLGYGMYNDEWPDGGGSSSRGHAKGVLGFDSAGGFWLVHSVPRFPVKPKVGYSGFPENEEKYAQTFLCISMFADQLDQVGIQLGYTWPSYYDNNFASSGLDRLYPKLSAAFQDNHTTDHSVHSLGLQRVSNAHFVSIAKTKYWGGDLYESGVAPFYRSNVLVESWMNGINPLDPCCKGDRSASKCPCPDDGSSCTAQYDAIDIRSLDWGISGASWSETQDHSKWAITETPSIVCIGDINRQVGQTKRGGGTVCRQSETLWSAFNKAIASKDSC